MICYTAQEEKLFRVQIYENKSRQRSTFAVNSALLPSDVMDFACCPLRDFDGKQFHCQLSCDVEVTNESARCWSPGISTCS